uniref:Guanylate cyclase activator 2B n=1 Tax=Stegastes partitus TaxID=144197 RepID=A0A3B5AU84_9TELE
MRALSVVLVMVLCLCTGALGVQVNVRGKSFPLKAVRQLKELMTVNDASIELTQKNIEDVCTDFRLPQVFWLVCHQYEMDRFYVFSKLVFNHLSECEICSFPACTGCLD